MKKQVCIIGCGMGNGADWTDKARENIEASSLVFSTTRLAKSLPLTKPVIVVRTPELVGVLRETAAEKICVLASGDVGFYSIASTLQRELGDEMELVWVSGISSLQTLTAACSIGYEQVYTMSLHGRKGSVLPAVTYHEWVFCLTGGDCTVSAILQELVENDLGSLSVVVGECLGGAEERIFRDTASALCGKTFDELAVLLLHNPCPAERQRRLRDVDFVRGKVPMTKELVRHAIVGMLEVRPTDTVYDIGAGTGAVSVCLARCAHESVLIAVERSTEGVSLLRANQKKLGVYNIHAVQAEASVGLADGPLPDKAFIGGSSGNLTAIVRALLSRNPMVEILMSATTLETLQEAIALFRQHEMDCEVVCLNVAKSVPLGNYQQMKAENPIYLIKGVPRDAE